MEVVERDIVKAYDRVDKDVEMEAKSMQYLLYCRSPLFTQQQLCRIAERNIVTNQGSNV